MPGSGGSWGVAGDHLESAVPTQTTSRDAPPARGGGFPERRRARVEGPPAETDRRFVIGISGASGADYSCRVVEQLLIAGHEVHLVVSEYGQRLLFDERGVRRVSLAELLPRLSESPWGEVFERRLVVHPNKNVGAVIASGSFLHHGMAVIPCSSTSLGAMATGAGSNLLTRAAMVTLKERRPLIVCHRETPLSLIDIENMRQLTLAGAVICPTNPGLYLLPRSVDDIIDFVAGKVLDLLGVEHGLDTRWDGA
ncbi:MAG: phenolic acid decarboxylase subunit B [Phycisphaeraceae bacterium]|nr:MAG: phenolic acid decarboxylase subunit B [Phycisphaeraceae bacterium]